MAIRFLDLEVYSIAEREVNKNLLLNFFLVQNHIKDIILVLDDNGVFSGIITYQMFINNNNEIENAIQREFVYFNDNIWEEAKKLVIRKSIRLLPVLDERGVIDYFCYNDSNLDYLLKVIKYAEKYISFENFKKIYPKIQLVKIYDMNEISYKLYNYFRKIGIEINIIGEKWKIIKKKEHNFLDDSNAPYYQILRIYSEGTDSIINVKEHFSKYQYIFVNDNFKCIDMLIKKQLEIDFFAEVKKLKEKNVFIRLIRVPEYEDLQEHSIIEELRHYLKSSSFVGKLEVDKYLIDVYGEELYEAFKNGEDIYPTIALHGNDFGLKNQYSKYLNVIDGKRITLGIPEEYENEIYFFGPCIIRGHGVDDKNTIPSLIQEILNEEYLDWKGRYCVRNCGEYGGCTYETLEYLRLLNLRENDIIFIIDLFSLKSQIDYDLGNLYNRKPKDEIWFSDTPIHTNKLGNKAVAREIMNMCIIPLIEKMDWNKKQSMLVKGINKELPQVSIAEGLKDYLNLLKNIKENSEYKKYQEGDVCAAIVMNCNPFTMGHRYLIETASKSNIDILYIFVVEEDKSFFSFKDRYQMVKKGTKDLDNVVVISGGNYIISNITFPEYFTKNMKQYTNVNPSMDINIFAQYIAPAMNISKRFAGEEPFDLVTKEYNKVMKEILPKYKIEFIEIPRLQVEDNPISASLVRKYLKENKLNLIEKLVPKTTMECLNSINLTSESVGNNVTDDE